MKHRLNSYTTWIELSKDAFSHNITQYKQAIGPNRHIAAVIKSNAYGHGIEALAPLIRENSTVHFVCVSTIAEALQARHLSISQPILVLYPDFLQLAPEALALSVRFSVSDYTYAQEINRLARLYNTRACIHLKVDTGMNRFGFYPATILELIEKIAELPHLYIEGIFTHFSDADNEDATYTNIQIHTFQQTLVQLQKKSFMFPYVHTANSSAAIIHNLSHTNMVRIGAGIYGLWASEYVHQKAIEAHRNLVLHPILTWKARILDIKEVPRNAHVGYACSYTTTAPMRIACINIGYFEGYHRRLSNIGTILIHNIPASICGRISMNVIMADISHIPHARIHDSALLIGPDQPISAIQIAQRIGSYNPREITTRIAAHIPRIVV